MNYLAHSFLSFSAEPVLFGQFIADDIKGNKWQLHDKHVQAGILLHRFIDDYTDTHPLVLDLKLKMHSELGKFSGVVLDVLLDHVLSNRWAAYSNVDRESWIVNTYSRLHNRHAEMSDKRKFILEKMIEHDWMNMYYTGEGTAKILNQMARRIPIANPLENSFRVYEAREKEIISTFDEFFPQILTATQSKFNIFAS
jgi:acyl carrier protein phosphodiesterase